MKNVLISDVGYGSGNRKPQIKISSSGPNDCFESTRTGSKTEWGESLGRTMYLKAEMNYSNHRFVLDVGLFDSADVEIVRPLRVSLARRRLPEHEYRALTRTGTTMALH